MYMVELHQIMHVAYRLCGIIKARLVNQNVILMLVYSNLHIHTIIHPSLQINFVFFRLTLLKLIVSTVL